MNGRKGTNIRMGELAVAGSESVLSTLLGSCIGLALYDRKNRLGGLAHIVLPHSHGKTDAPGKYVDTAIPELLQQIQATGGNPQRLNARIAGGADMFNTGSETTIGVQNIQAVEDALRELRIPVAGRHCGGDQGRRMTFQIESGAVYIKQVGLEEEIEI